MSDTHFDWNAIPGSFVINAAAVWRPQFWRNFSLFAFTVQFKLILSINPCDDHQTISVNNRQQPEMMSTYKKRSGMSCGWIFMLIYMCVCVCVLRPSPFIGAFEEWSSLKKCRFFDRMIINYSNLSSARWCGANLCVELVKARDVVYFAYLSSH